MLIYNRAYFNNFFLLLKAKEWRKSGLLSEEEYAQLSKQYPNPYKSFNIFARIGSFIFILFTIGSGIGLFNLILSGIKIYNYFSFQCFLFGIVFYILAELSIRELNLFRTGIKGALLYFSVCALCSGTTMLIRGDKIFYSDTDPLLYYACAFPIIVFAAIRFSDHFLSLSALACLYVIDALLMFKLGTPGKMILPFESMALSFLIYSVTVKLKNKTELHFWKSPMALIETASLITLYLSGNYMVVRYLTETLMHTVIKPGEDISLNFFFYAYTVIIPLVYIWFGLKRKSYLFLRLGLILEVAGILSIKYYHHIMPPETAMILGGMVMILLAYFSIKYLKTPKHGITYELYKRSGKEAMVNIAGVFTSKVVAANQSVIPQKQDGIEFGGGDGGGGGASANY